MPSPHLITPLLPFLLTLGTVAQCPSTWSPPDAVTSGFLWCAEATPDGGWLVGGNFQSIAGVPATRVARFDGVAWHAIGSIARTVQDVAAMHDGEMFAVTDQDLLHWDGSAWTVVPGVSGYSGARLLVRLNGNLLLSSYYLYEWNGTAWSTYPGVTNVRSMANLPNGDFVASGFATSFPNGARVAQSNGTTWLSLDPGWALPSITHVAAGPGGTVISLDTFGGAREWNGATWTSIWTTFNGRPNDLATLANGDVILTGTFTTSSSAPLPYLARWDGTTLTDVAGGLSAPGSLVSVGANGHLLAARSAPHDITLLTSPCAASNVPLGPGCASNGALVARTWPQIGARYRAYGTGLSSAAAIEIVGLQPISLDLAQLHPWGQPGCIMHAFPDVSVVGSIVNGVVQAGFNIPANVGLTGVAIYQQFILLDVGLTPTLTATNALALTIGSMW